MGLIPFLVRFRLSNRSIRTQCLTHDPLCRARLLSPPLDVTRRPDSTRSCSSSVSSVSETSVKSGESSWPSPRSERSPVLSSPSTRKTPRDFSKVTRFFDDLSESASSPSRSRISSSDDSRPRSFLGLAKSIHHARVLIRQRHIRVRKQVVNVPSYVVRLDSQKHIDFSLRSPLGGGRPGRVKRKNALKGKGGGADDDEE